jgi:Flp pilus assembly protein TadD
LVAYDVYARAISMIYNVQVPSESTADTPLDAGKTLSEAVDLLNKAVARDPNFFLAYCQLAFVHDLVYQSEIDHTPTRLALAQSAIDSAFRLRPKSGESHLALGWHLYLGKSEFDRARASLAIAQESLPNNPQAFELAGLIDMDQGRWSDAQHNLEHASELDPRNLPYLIQLGGIYNWVHDYDQWAQVMDRILALHPDRKPARIFRAVAEVYQRADTRPLQVAIEKILANDPASEKDPFLVSWRFSLALFNRELDTANSLVPALPQKVSFGVGFPLELRRDFWVGVVARLKGDETSARAAFMRARAEQEEEVRGHPDAAGLLSCLGVIDAALGRKEEALREGRRAMELLAVAKSSMTESLVKTYFAIACAWTGERELALQQLDVVAKLPGGPSYGDLRLSPLWDPLRDDPRFEKIVAALAPKEMVAK